MIFFTKQIKDRWVNLLVAATVSINLLFFVLTVYILIVIISIDTCEELAVL